MINISLNKYCGSIEAVSKLHHLDDALDLLSLLSAEEYVRKQLHENHQKTRLDSHRLAKRISSHAKLAEQYARLSLTSPVEISFLPGYYAVLNLAKIFSLSGSYSHEFDAHASWHGVQYSGSKKNSRNIFTEEITVNKGGALALFYKTLTKTAITKKRIIQLKDIYRIVPGVGSEFQMVTGIDNSPLVINIRALLANGVITVEADVDLYTNGAYVPFTKGVHLIPCLNGFVLKPGTFSTYMKSRKANPGDSLEKAAHSLIRPEYLLYKISSNIPDSCYEQSSVLPMPEEFASALAYFHMSSVCRYNPEFLEKLSKKEEWAMLLSARRHTLYYFLISTFSFVTQKNYCLLS